jgi:hypothetical protein
MSNPGPQYTHDAVFTVISENPDHLRSVLAAALGGTRAVYYTAPTNKPFRFSTAVTPGSTLLDARTPEFLARLLERILLEWLGRLSEAEKGQIHRGYPMEGSPRTSFTGFHLRVEVPPAGRTDMALRGTFTPAWSHRHYAVPATV